MKFCRDEIHACKLFIAYHDSGFIVAGVQGSFYQQPCFCGRMGDKIDDHLVACQRTAAPVFSDKAKEAMLDFIPFAGARWEMANL
jgi:hypothetical protein